MENRDATLLTLLREPRTVEEIVNHRLVYRPHVEGAHVEPIERRTAVRHLELLLSKGLVTKGDHGRFWAT